MNTQAPISVKFPEVEASLTARFPASRSTLGTRIEAARIASGLSQRELGSIFGETAGKVGSWESDESVPQPYQLLVLAGQLDVTMVWLLAGKTPGEDRRRSFSS